jgi:hypothetical protein
VTRPFGKLLSPPLPALAAAALVLIRPDGVEDEAARRETG